MCRSWRRLFSGWLGEGLFSEGVFLVTKARRHEERGQGEEEGVGAFREILRGVRGGWGYYEGAGVLAFFLRVIGNGFDDDT